MKCARNRPARPDGKRSLCRRAPDPVWEWWSLPSVVQPSVFGSAFSTVPWVEHIFWQCHKMCLVRWFLNDMIFEVKKQRGGNMKTVSSFNSKKPFSKPKQPGNVTTGARSTPPLWLDHFHFHTELKEILMGMCRTWKTQTNSCFQPSRSYLVLGFCSHALEAGVSEHKVVLGSIFKKTPNASLSRTKRIR